MTNCISLLLPPLVGGVIGYITNDLAIRMLFRPHTPKYLFGHRIPFTPGLIPKEKSRVASSVASAISTNLMNKEVIESHLLGDDMIQKVSLAVDTFVAKQKENTETLHEFLLKFIEEDKLISATSEIKEDVCKQISARLTDEKLGEEISVFVVNHIRQNGLGGMLPGRFASVIMDVIEDKVKSYLTKNINEMLKAKGSEIVSDLVSNGVENFLSKPIKSILEGKEKQIEEASSFVVSLYKKLISEQLPQILKSIDIEKIVVDRINEMDVAEMEKLILEVMNKELRAIIWLGALLGMVMGCANSILNLFN